MAEKAKKKAQPIAPQVEEAQEITPDSPLKLDFFQKNQRIIYAVAAGIFLVLIGILFWRDLRQKKNDEARAEMFRAVVLFENDSVNLAVSGRAGEFMGLEEIANSYKGTDAGNLANYYLGIAHIREGRLDEGIEALEAFSKGDNLVGMSAYMALAFAYEDKGEDAKAASLFQKAAETPAKNERYTPMLYLHAGRCYEASGKHSSALKLYETIKKEYPNSPEGIRIEKYIARASK